MASVANVEWIGLPELCAITGWKIGTAYNRISRGLDMPLYHKTGKNVRFKMSDVDAWLEKQQRMTAAAQLQLQNA
jgi:predicted DNA-binding transcriptional regulator AlpA